MDQPLISVIIPTCYREHLLLLCVDSIEMQDYAHWEALIIDQDPKQSLRERLSQRYPGDTRLRYFYLERAGASRARNLGIQNARAKIVAFIDDDAAAEPGWLLAIASAFSRDPSLVLVAGRIEPLWASKRPRWYPGEREFLLGLYNIGNEMRPMPEHDQPISANMAGLREVILKLGGFDESLGFDHFRKRMITGEDATLGIRSRRAGYTPYYHPGMVVRHRISESKVTRRYFLRRHFWEGVTTIAQMNLLGELPLHRRDILRFHTKILCMSVARFVLPNYKSTYPYPKPQIRMLALSKIALSAGICYGLLTTLNPPPTEKL